ncbi:MAG TPA: ankyrin repeat domain-containing protein [Candidatus Babeliaceae bacterium]|nr:ankyrin repeat domain-containing protein [Candidatus Babeliaceae bacterium]
MKKIFFSLGLFTLITERPILPLESKTLSEREIEIFMNAVRMGNLEVLRKSITQLNIDTYDEDGFTALLHAASSNNSEVVDFLINNGADVTIPDKHGLTALHYAAHHGNTHAIALLLENGADPNANNNTQGHTPLMLAAQTDSTESVKLLLNNNACPTMLDCNDKSAMDHAREQDNVRSVSMILEALDIY